ncbi:hypothetical protein M0638_27680 [Roseomonas sp. NAR14]|uniref:Uncharacterized protein n=1 Tax=Roseomonas acroporae TaxID=2937791 RepID=A0A9X1YCY8_9PROT|nr:hypothetical protein [Roseomonas acroporae]MCK8788139.1 hypothetical protein [Roseomonas acroporae]
MSGSVGGNDPWSVFPLAGGGPGGAAAPAMSPAAPGAAPDPWSAFPLAGAAPAAAGGGTTPAAAAAPARGGSLYDLAGTAVSRGLGAIAGLPNAAAEADRWLLRRLFGEERGDAIARYLDVGADHAPTQQQAAAAIMDRAGVRETEAESRLGRLAQRGVEFAVGSAVPLPLGPALRAGGLGARLGELGGQAVQGARLGAIAGVASEAAGQATAGTAAEPYARAAAGAAVPLAAGAASLANRGSATVARRALEGVTDTQLAVAERLMAQSRAAGTPLTADEAIQQVTGANQRLQTLRRTVEQAEQGAPLRQLMQERPAANRAAFGRMADAELPAADPLTAPTIPARLSAAAEQVLAEARRARTDATRPIFEMAQRQLSTPAARPQVRQAVEQAIAEMDQAIRADQSGLLARQLDPVRRSFQRPGASGRLEPVTDIESIERARRYFRDTLAAPPAPGQPVIDRELAARVGTALNGLRDRLRGLSDSLATTSGRGPYGVALDRYADISRTQVEPLESGLIGAVSRQPTAPGQYRTLVPDAPSLAALPTTPAATRQAVRQLAARDPGAAQDLISTYVRGAFEEASQRLGSAGQREQGAAGFAATVAGNAEQRAVLRSAIEAAHGPEAWRGFERLLDVFDAQQYRAAAGSQTTFNTAMRDDLTRGGLVQGAVAAANVPAWSRRLREVMEDLRYGRNVGRIADILTSAEGVQRLRALARQPAGSAGAAAILGGLFAGSRGWSDAPGDAATTP